MNPVYVHGYDPRENQRLHNQADTLVELLHWDTFYPSGSRVLKAGCGVGAQTLTLARNSPGARITSFDVSEASVAQAKREADAAGLTNVQFQRADIFALPHGPESFDHVFVCFVLEHLVRPTEALAALRTVLRPGGTITVIEGDHGSAYFYPDSEAAHQAIRCLVELQRTRGRQCDDRAGALSSSEIGGVRPSSRVSPDGLRRWEQAGARRWFHEEDVHRDDRGCPRVRTGGWNRGPARFRPRYPRPGRDDRVERSILLHVFQGRRIPPRA